MSRSLSSNLQMTRRGPPNKMLRFFRQIHSSSHLPLPHPNGIGSARLRVFDPGPGNRPAHVTQVNFGLLTFSCGGLLIVFFFQVSHSWPSCHCSRGRINAVPTPPPPSLVVTSTPLTAAAVSAPSLPPRPQQQWQHRHRCLGRSNNRRRTVTAPTTVARWPTFFFLVCTLSLLLSLIGQFASSLLAIAPSQSRSHQGCASTPIATAVVSTPWTLAAAAPPPRPRQHPYSGAAATVAPSPSPSPRPWHRHHHCRVRGSTLAAAGAAATPSPPLRAHDRGGTHIATAVAAPSKPPGP
jgi:hypothetical protein